MKDPEDPWTFDDGYLEDLSSRNQERFEEDFDDNLNEFNEDTVERRLQTRFNQAEEHLKLVKAAAACFHPREGAGRSESGFRYVGVDPLQAVDENPADVLLVKPEYNGAYFCVVCCEIGGESRKDWIDNVNEARRVFESRKNRDVLTEQLGIENDDLSFQYVTLTRTDDTVEMDFSVLDRNCDADTYAVWSADVEDKWMMYEDGSFVHADLRSAFSDQLDYMRREDPLKYTVGTHPVFPLQQIVYQVVKEKFEFDDEQKSEFAHDTFYEFFDQGLQIQCSGERRECVVSSEVDRLLDMALKTGVFSDEDDDLRSDNRDYRIMYSGTRGPDHAENAVKPKYFDNVGKVQVGQLAYNKTREEFDPETDLGNYGAL